MDPGLAALIFMGVVLKIPIAFACWLLWYAFNAKPDPAEAPGGDDGHGFRRFGPEKPRPHGPRRGPHAPDSLPLPDCPPGGRARRTKAPATPLPLRVVHNPANERGRAHSE